MTGCPDQRRPIFRGWKPSTSFSGSIGDVQVERLMKRDHLSKDEAEFRLVAQWPSEKKKDLASHVLNNNGNQDQLLTQMFSLLEGGKQDDRD